MAEKVECKVSLSKWPRKTVSSVCYKLSISDFSILPKYGGTMLKPDNPFFEFANASWCFGIKLLDSVRTKGLMMNVTLFRLNWKISKQTIVFKIIFSDFGDEECPISGEWDFEKHVNANSLCYLDSKTVSNISNDTASVIIQLLHIESTEEEADQASVATNKGCRGSLVHSNDFRPLIENIFYMLGNQDVEGLSQDFKKLLLNGKNYDLTLRVADKEFRVHRDVLMARCPVFESMLSHDMTEKNQGIINVPDCDPVVMEEFLLFVYSGKAESLNRDNMLGLYYAADKYQMLFLKEECSKFIKKSLFPSIICYVVQLALNHSDTDLLESATKYFINHASEIFPTVEWISFMKSNTTVANELLIKLTKMWHPT